MLRISQWIEIKTQDDGDRSEWPLLHKWRQPIGASKHDRARLDTKEEVPKYCIPLCPRRRGQRRMEDKLCQHTDQAVACRCEEKGICEESPLSQDLSPVRCVTVAEPVGLYTRRDRPFVTVAFHLTLRSVAMQTTSRSLSSR
jgi:hypothetical protein